MEEKQPRMGFDGNGKQRRKLGERDTTTPPPAEGGSFGVPGRDIHVGMPAAGSSEGCTDCVSQTGPGGMRRDSGHLCVPGSSLPRQRVWRGKVACIQPEGSHRAGLALSTSFYLARQHRTDGILVHAAATRPSTIMAPAMASFCRNSC